MIHDLSNWDSVHDLVSSKAAILECFTAYLVAAGY